MRVLIGLPARTTRSRCSRASRRSTPRLGSRWSETLPTPRRPQRDPVTLAPASASGGHRADRGCRKEAGARAGDGRRGSKLTLAGGIVHRRVFRHTDSSPRIDRGAPRRGHPTAAVDFGPERPCTKQSIALDQSSISSCAAFSCVPPLSDWPTTLTPPAQSPRPPPQARRRTHLADDTCAGSPGVASRWRRRQGGRSPSPPRRLLGADGRQAFSGFGAVRRTARRLLHWPAQARPACCGSLCASAAPLDVLVREMEARLPLVAPWSSLGLLVLRSHRHSRQSPVSRLWRRRARPTPSCRSTAPDVKPRGVRRSPPPPPKHPPRRSSPSSGRSTPVPAVEPGRCPPRRHTPVEFSRRPAMALAPSPGITATSRCVRLTSHSPRGPSGLSHDKPA